MKTFAKMVVGLAAAGCVVAAAGAASATAYINPWDADSGLFNISVTGGDAKVGTGDAFAEYHSVDFGGGPVMATPADGIGYHDLTSPSTFKDDFYFFLPSGYVNWFVSSTGSQGSHLNFTSVIFNGVAFSIANTQPPPTGTPWTSKASSPFDQFVVANGMQHLTVIGTFAGTGPNANPGNASYTFSGSFAAAPEPASWGLMIMGFGGLGALMRNNRRRQARAFA